MIFENALFRQFDKIYGIQDNSWIDLIGIVLNGMRIVSCYFARAASMKK